MYCNYGVITIILPNIIANRMLNVGLIFEILFWEVEEAYDI